MNFDTKIAMKGANPSTEV